VCNLYAMMKGRAEVAALARALSDFSHNQPPMPGVYPDYEAPVVVVGEDGQRLLRDMRWGMPSSKRALMDAATKRADALRKKGTEFDFNELLKLEPDKGTTNCATRPARRPARPTPIGARGRVRPTAASCRSRRSPSRTRTTRGPARTSGSRCRKTARSPSSPAFGRRTPASA